MNIFQESCCSILGVLLFFLLQGSFADPDAAKLVHKAVGESLELIADYPTDDLEVQWKYYDKTFAEYRNKDFQKVKSELFNERLKMYKDNISITIENLKLQDSGSFSTVAVGKSGQHPTKIIELRVHARITDVQIVYNDSWSQLQNICTFHLRCLASGDPNSSYSWTGHQVKTQGQRLNISLRRAENATLNCTANNTVSVKYTTENVVCTKKSDDPSFLQEYLLIVVGVVIVVVVIFSGTVAVCCRWRKNKGQGESEAGITVYEDVNIDVTAKKRSESVVNGMSIYETVDDTKKVSQNLPQTLYDKINYQRHPAASASTSSPYQEVL